jgi:hypothetical protein
VTLVGWHLTANLIWGIQFNDVTGRPQLSPCPAPLGVLGCNPDFLNLDLTATKKFGQWEIGAVGFGSTDLKHPVFRSVSLMTPRRISRSIV